MGFHGVRVSLESEDKSNILVLNVLSSDLCCDPTGVAIIEKQTPEGKVSVRVCKSPNHGGEYHIRYADPTFKHSNTRTFKHSHT